MQPGSLARGGGNRKPVAHSQFGELALVFYQEVARMGLALGVFSSRGEGREDF